VLYFLQAKELTLIALTCLVLFNRDQQRRFLPVVVEIQGLSMCLSIFSADGTDLVPEYGMFFGDLQLSMDDFKS
jgi:hypothetical protein